MGNEENIPESAVVEAQGTEPSGTHSETTEGGDSAGGSPDLETQGDAEKLGDDDRERVETSDSPAVVAVFCAMHGVFHAEQVACPYLP